MAAPNMLSITQVLGKTAFQAVGTSLTAVVANASNSNQLIKINQVMVSNKNTATAVDFTMDILRSAVSYPISSNVSVPAKSTLVAVGKDTAIYLEEGDSLRCSASSATDLTAIVSYEQIS